MFDLQSFDIVKFDLQSFDIGSFDVQSWSQILSRNNTIAMHLNLSPNTLTGIRTRDPVSNSETPATTPRAARAPPKFRYIRANANGEEIFASNLRN
jgi:hypothetical protein